MVKNQSGFKEIQHTADAALSVWADNLNELFKNSLKGMYQLIGISSNFTQENDVIHIALQAEDTESLLVSFLSECLFFVLNKRLFLIPEELEINDGMLNCKMQVISINKINKEIKAVTFHNLRITNNKKGYKVIIVFDI
jgi:SHS2 domain-containing protein